MGIWKFLILWWLLILGLSIWGRHHLPSYKTKDQYTPSFDAEQAEGHLKHLCGTIGTHPSGTPKGEEAMNYVHQTILEILSQKSPNIHSVVEFQNGSGFCNYSIFYHIAFDNVTNLMVRLSKDNLTKPHRKLIMVSSHYDSAVQSPGASDDGIAVVSLLEILRLFTSDDSLWKDAQHDLLLMWSGAEELGLLGSHLFTQRHPWASEIIGFVNLEASGASDREYLFQTSDYGMTKLYADHAPFPSGTVIGQDLFNLQLVMGNTDFVNYLKRSPHGLDWAFVHNGYVYHTYRDRLDQISIDSIFHMGQNAATLAMHLLKTPASEFQKPEFQGIRSLFFDVMGRWMIHMDMDTASALGYSLSLISVLDWIRTHQSRQSLTWAMASLLCTVLSWAASISLSVGFSFVLHAISPFGNRSWFSHHWMIILLYVPLGILGNLGIHSFFGKMEKSYKLSAEKVWKNIYSGEFLFQLVLLLAGSYYKIGASYIFFIWVLCLFTSNYVQSFSSTSNFQLYFILNVSLAMFLVTDLSYAVLLLYIPMMGKVPTGMTHAMIAGISTLFFVNLTFSPILALSRLYPARNFWKFLLGTVGACVVMATIFNLKIFPYTESTPQRVNVQHIFYVKENGQYFKENRLSFVPIGTPLSKEEYFSENSAKFQWKTDKRNHAFPTAMRPNIFGAFFSEMSHVNQDEIQLESVKARAPISVLTVHDGRILNLKFRMPTGAISVDIKASTDKLNSTKGVGMTVDGHYFSIDSLRWPNQNWITFIHGGSPSGKFLGNAHEISLHDPEKVLPMDFQLEMVTCYPYSTPQLEHLAKTLPNWIAPHFAIEIVNTFSIEWNRTKKDTGIDPI